MAKAKSEKKAKTNLVVRVGASMEVPVRLQSLKTGKAGTVGISWKTACSRVVDSESGKQCREQIRMPKVCPVHGEDGAQDPLKMYDGSGMPVYLPSVVVDQLRPVAEEVATLLHFAAPAEVPVWDLPDEVAQVMPGTRVMLPPEGDARGMARYAGLARMLRSRVGILQLYERKGTTYLAMRVTRSGIIVVQEWYKPEHTKAINAGDVPVVKDGEVGKGLEAKAAELTRPLDWNQLNYDPARERMEDAIIRADMGEIVRVEEVVAAKVADEEEDLLALI